MEKGELNWWYTCGNTERLRWFLHFYIYDIHYIYYAYYTYFPNQLKLAKVTPASQKEDEVSKENHRPVKRSFPRIQEFWTKSL